MDIENYQKLYDKTFNIEIEIAVLKNEYGHFHDTLSEILESVKKTESLILKVESLEKKVEQLEVLIHEKTDYKAKLNKFALSTRHWIALITFLAVAAGYVMEILYKLPPPPK
jgi:predicted RNase H-like nuclease (RuvC/YqgF family)